MSVTVEPHVRSRVTATTPGRPTSSLFRRLLLFNAAVVALGGLALLLSPATVSSPALITEVAVLVVGAVAMVAVNAVLVRATLRPLDRLTALMDRVDLLHPGERLAVPADRDMAYVIGRFNQMLERLEHERGVSAAHALAAQESERQRIARELHDEIGQSLTAALLGLKRAADRAPEPVAAEVVEVQETIRGCLDEVRMVARRLRPGVLEDLGLRSAISALAAEFTRAADIPIETTVDSRLAPLDPDAELVLYRIAQEGLTNVARHAGATRVTLTLANAAGSVELTITDDGAGIGDRPEGAGIRGMRERAMLIGATLTLSEERAPEPATGPGGTRLRLTVPNGPDRFRPEVGRG